MSYMGVLPAPLHRKQLLFSLAGEAIDSHQDDHQAGQQEGAQVEDGRAWWVGPS